MAYQKILIDNPRCERRFHVTFDDAAEKVASFELKCSHCDAVIYQGKNEPQAILARDENLIKTTELSQYIARDCNFNDKFPPKKN